MAIRNTRDLERRLSEVARQRESFRQSFFTTTDRTRDVAGSVQKGLYFGQLALSVFRNLTNYHVAPNKRVKRVVLSILGIILLNFLRKKLVRRSS